MKRPILIALLGYIIGIIWELYLKTSIVLFVISTIIIYILAKIVLKQINTQKLSRMQKRKIRRIRVCIQAKKTPKIIIILLIFATISNFIIKKENEQYDKKFQNITQGKFVATIVEQQKQTNYNRQYKIKLDTNTYLLLKVKEQTQLELGDKIEFMGKLELPQEQRNYKGFDYKEYLKTKKIYGTVTTKSVKVVKQNNLGIIQNIANQISKYMKENLKNRINQDEQYQLLLGLLIGADDNLKQEIKEDFKNSSLSHILAVSGMHVSYVILSLSLLCCKLNLSKKITKIIILFLLILFTCITGFSASVLRAVIMSFLIIGADLLYKKSDTINTISISLFILLIDNPFCIKDIGLLLSFAGTIGILFIQPQIRKRFDEKNRELALANQLTPLEKIYKKIAEIAMVSISAQICILPITMYYFHTISLTFLISNILVSFLMGPIIILGFLVAILPLPLLPQLLKVLLSLLMAIAKTTSLLPLSQINITTPNLFTILLYYFTIYLFFAHVWKKKLKLSTFVHNLHKYVSKKRKMLITIGIIVCMISRTYTHIKQNELIIHFIDVGQGDSMLITTGNNKILIDGGGSNNQDFDVGESILLPYLLNRKVKTLDYIIISHLDMDHVRSEF